MLHFKVSWDNTFLCHLIFTNNIFQLFYIFRDLISFKNPWETITWPPSPNCSWSVWVRWYVRLNVERDFQSEQSVGRLEEKERHIFQNTEKINKDVAKWRKNDWVWRVNSGPQKTPWQEFQNEKTENLGGETLEELIEENFPELKKEDQTEGPLHPELSEDRTPTPDTLGEILEHAAQEDSTARREEGQAAY